MNEHATNAGVSQPAYPLARPADTDPRFTYGLLHDIAEALQRNGYPRPSGTDWADLTITLHRFLYQKEPS